MRCDVCNAAIPKGTGDRITPETFIYLMDNGFGLDETNIRMLTDGGMSRAAAETALKEQYRGSISDWLLCSNCTAKAMHIMNERAMYHTSRYANNLHCLYCEKTNASEIWPLYGDSTAFYYEPDPGEYSIEITCSHCNKRWFVVWDYDPGPFSTGLPLSGK